MPLCRCRSWYKSMEEQCLLQICCTATFPILEMHCSCSVLRTTLSIGPTQECCMYVLSRCAIISDAPANLKVKWTCFCVGIWQFLGESSNQWTLQFSHTTWELRIQKFELATEAILFILWADLHHNGNCWCICGMFSPGHCISNFWCGGKVVWGQENSNTLASSPMVVSKLGVKIVWNSTAQPPRLSVQTSLS